MMKKYNFNALIQTNFGTMLVNPNDRYIGQALIKFGAYSWNEILLLEQLIPPDGTVVEAGSNIGSHTVPLAQRLLGGGHIYAFEPQRLVFQQLCANIALNQLTNVSTYWAALDNSTDGHIYFPYISPFVKNNFGALSAAKSGDSVKKMTIDSLELKQCHLIKIDVEGMELKVLQGATETIKAHRPVIYFEADRKDKRSAIFKHLKELNYQFWWDIPLIVEDSTISNAPFETDDSLKEIEKVYSVNVLAVPKEKDSEITGLPPVDDYSTSPVDDHNKKNLSSSSSPTTP